MKLVIYFLLTYTILNHANVANASTSAGGNEGKKPVDFELVDKVLDQIFTPIVIKAIRGDAGGPGQGMGEQEVQGGPYTAHADIFQKELEKKLELFHKLLDEILGQEDSMNKILSFYSEFRPYWDLVDRYLSLHRRGYYDQLIVRQLDIALRNYYACTTRRGICTDLNRVSNKLQAVLRLERPDPLQEHQEQFLASLGELAEIINRNLDLLNFSQFLPTNSENYFYKGKRRDSVFNQLAKILNYHAPKQIEKREVSPTLTENPSTGITAQDNPQSLIYTDIDRCLVESLIGGSTFYFPVSVHYAYDEGNIIKLPPPADLNDYIEFNDFRRFCLCGKGEFSNKSENFEPVLSPGSVLNKEKRFIDHKKYILGFYGSNPKAYDFEQQFCEASSFGKYKELLLDLVHIKERQSAGSPDIENNASAGSGRLE